MSTALRIVPCAGRAQLRVLACFLIPAFLFPVVGLRPYLHYKCMSFLLPLFHVAAFIGLYALLQMKKRALWRVVPLLYAAMLFYLCVWRSLPLFGSWPVLQEETFREMEQVRREGIVGKRALILSKEDYLLYYMEGFDDWLPMTIYHSVQYNGEVPDTVVLDHAFGDETASYLAPRPRLLELLRQAPPRCVTFRGARFDVLSYQCLIAGK